MMVKRFQLFVAGELFYVLLMIVPLHEGLLAERCRNAIAYLNQSLRGFEDAAQVERLAMIPHERTHRSGRQTNPIETPRRDRDRSLLSAIERRLELFHGSVVNHYDQKILCWTGEPNPYSGGKTFFYLDPGQTSHPGIDVDHIQDPSGQWWKVGWATVSVASDSAVIDAKCRTAAQNKPCLE